MRQAETAPRVFDLLERTPLTEFRGCPLAVPPSDIAKPQQ